MREVATIVFRDLLENDDDACAVVKAAPGCVTVTLSLRSNGDIEVGLPVQDATTLAAALQAAVTRASSNGAESAPRDAKTSEGAPQTSERAQPLKAALADAAREAFQPELRDYFAAKAMQGYRASPSYCMREDEEIAAWAYKQADAMLTVRGIGRRTE
jgi:hypothetical protein